MPGEADAQRHIGMAIEHLRAGTARLIVIGAPGDGKVHSGVRPRGTASRAHDFHRCRETPVATVGVVSRIPGVRDPPALAMRTPSQCSSTLSVIQPVLADHAEAVVREAFGSAIRRGGATEVTVRVRIDDQRSVEVDHNSSDIAPRGLVNLRRCAEETGRTFHAGTPFAVQGCRTGRPPAAVNPSVRLAAPR